MRIASHFFYILFFHVLGANRINIGNSSSLPAIISIDRIDFDSQEKFAYPPDGPTAPRPGPIFEIQARLAVIIVNGS